MCKVCTDVPASISGYYYQILLAIRELVKLSDDYECVGIEKGADIRIFCKKDNVSSIEAKFYSKDFNRWSTPIIHTVYNFYNNLVESDNKLTFETNVIIDDSLIKEICNVNKVEEIKEEHIKYVCIAIMKESLYKKSNICGGNLSIGDAFKRFLIENSKEIDFNKKITEKHYEFFYNRYKECNVLDFFGSKIDKLKVKNLIKKIEFNHGCGNEKYETIRNIKDDIKNHLNKYEIEIGTEDIIIQILVDDFLKTTLRSDELSFIKVADLKSKLCEIKNNNYKLSLNYYNKEFISKIEDLDNKVLEQIEDSYYGKYENQLFNRYVIVREKVLGKLRQNEYGKIDEVLKNYTLSHESINTFDELVKFITIFTVFNKIDFNLIELIESTFSNIKFGEDKILYKSHDNLASNAILNSFIRNTVDHIEKNDEESTVVFSGDIVNGKRPCETNIKNSRLFRITEVNSNRELIKYYKKLKYKCKGCIYFFEDDEEAKEKIEKFKCCEGWKSWE